MQYSKPQVEINILRSIGLIAIAFILLLTTLPPMFATDISEAYASSNGDDEDSDDEDRMLDNDVLNIVGEIRNTDSVSADFVEVIATFYDATNSTLGSDNTF